jgi:hypothetical protein
MGSRGYPIARLRLGVLAAVDAAIATAAVDETSCQASGISGLSGTTQRTTKVARESLRLFVNVAARQFVEIDEQRYRLPLRILERDLQILRRAK